jgi:hypothetical protein
MIIRPKLRKTVPCGDNIQFTAILTKGSSQISKDFICIESGVDYTGNRWVIKIRNGTRYQLIDSDDPFIYPKDRKTVRYVTMY